MPKPKKSREKSTIGRTVSALAGRQTRAALRNEISDSRRAAVYRTDVQFAEVKKSTPLAETPDLVRRIRELRERGLSFLAIETELYEIGILAGRIRKICAKHNIEKGSKSGKTG